MLMKYQTTGTPDKSFGTRDDGPLHGIGFRHSPHCCSWKRFDKGVGIIEFDTHDITQYVSISVTETTEGGKSSKSAHMTLNHDEAIKLRDWLTNHIGDWATHFDD